MKTCKDFFRVPSFCTRLIGIWPLSADRRVLSRWTWKSQYRAYLLTSLLALCGCVEVRYLMQDVSELIEVLDALFLSVTIVMGVFKIIIALMYRDGLRRMLLKLYDSFIDERRLDCRRVYNEQVRYADFFCLMFTASAYLTCIGYNLKPLVLNAFRYFNGQPLKMQWAFESDYPFDVYFHPLFDILYVKHTMCALITINSFCGVSGMYFTSCAHVAAQFQMLRIDVEKLIVRGSDDNKPLTPAENRSIHAQLTMLMKKHYALLELVKQVSNIFAPVILVHFISDVLTISINSILILLCPLAVAVIYILFSLACVVEVYVFTAGGANVLDSSLGVAESIYALDWHRCDAINKKTLMIMIHYTQRGSRIRVPFYDIELPTFTKVISSICSYIVVLKKVLLK